MKDGFGETLQVRLFAFNLFGSPLGDAPPLVSIQAMLIPFLFGSIFSDFFIISSRPE